MKRILLCLICIFSLLGSKAQSYNDWWKKLWTILSRIVCNKLRNSFARLYGSILTMPGMRCFFSNLGTVLKRQGKIDEAIDSYTMALNITPYATAILLNRATLYMEKNLTEKAYLDYCNVIDLLPNDKELVCFVLISI